MNTKSVTFGILGLGEHAKYVIIPSFADCHNAILRGVASTHPTSRKYASERHCSLSVYADYEALLLDHTIDAIIVALPNHLHAPWAIRALEAGKHVLVEKPFALNIMQARAMHDAANRALRKVREAFMYRFHHQHGIAIELIRSGALGDIRLFEAHYRYHLEDRLNIRLRADCGGGGLNDVGCYLIDAARFILGAEPQSISCAWHIHPTYQIDDSAILQLHFPQDITAVLTCGCSLPRANYYTVVGTRGQLTVPSAFLTPHNKRCFVEITDQHDKKTRLKVEPINQTAAMLDAFASLICDQPVSDSLFSNGLQNSYIIEMARKAASNNSLLQLPIPT